MLTAAANDLPLADLREPDGETRLAKEVGRHPLALRVELDRRPERHGASPPAAAIVGEARWIEVLALNVADDPVNDSITELGTVGERCAHLFEERGVAGWW